MATRLDAPPRLIDTPARHAPRVVQALPLRVALFSGNFNYTQDGANLSLNRLVAYLVAQGVVVRIYSPTGKVAAFEPAAPLVSVPSWPLPGRSDYRMALGLPASIRADLAAFQPHLVHVSAPDLLGLGAQRWARQQGLPIIASYHTRFETYLSYYRLGWLQGLARAYLHAFYRRCDKVLVPNDGVAHILRPHIGATEVQIWSRGVDRERFDPRHRSPAWRRAHGLAADDYVIGFAGRLVLEKGLATFVACMNGLREKGLPHRVMIVGDGPQAAWLQAHLPQAVFTGFLNGEALAQAYANMDVFYNPSTTETFGNVTLEAMASGVPVVAMRSLGAQSLVIDTITGFLVAPDDVAASVTALMRMGQSASMRTAMAAAARTESARYSWDDILADVLAQYRDTLANTSLKTHA